MRSGRAREADVELGLDLAVDFTGGRDAFDRLWGGWDHRLVDPERAREGLTTLRYDRTEPALPGE
jgi:hypothetical protein